MPDVRSYFQRGTNLVTQATTADRFMKVGGVLRRVQRVAPGDVLAPVGGLYDSALYDTDTYATNATIPGAPTSVAVSSSTTDTATITWQPPASNGNTPISGYRVSRDGVSTTGVGPITFDVPASSASYTMSPLVSGGTYNLSVAAVNAAGEGPEVTMAVIVSATAGATVPSIPTAVLVTAPSTSQATVAWSPPVSDGGSPITGYRVSRDGTATSGTVNYTTVVAATARSFTMNLLYPARTYNLSVAAINGVGTGPTFTGAVTIPEADPPVNLPSVPTSVTRAAPSPTSAIITWAAPASTGGSAITGYRVARDGVGGTSTVAPASATSYTFGGLTGSTAYFLSVAAINSAGEGPASFDDVVTPAASTGPAAPGAATSVVGSSPSTSQATITWAPPASDGGSAITGYRVTRDGVATSGTGAYSTVVAATARSFTMNLLFTGSEYNLTVAAINAIGTGPAGSVAILVGGAASTTVPTVPTSVTRTSPTSDTAVINWQPPASIGGSAITGYRVSRDGTSSTGTGAFTTTVAADIRTFSFGLMRPGVTYNLSVAAINTQGEGPASTGPVTIATDAVPDTPSGAAMPTGNLQDFTLLFTDDFSTDAAEGTFLTKYTRWRAYPNTYKDTSGRGTYEPRVISVANSIMTMALRYEAASGRFLCAAPEPKINGAGARGQTYGRYSVRFNVPTASRGYKTAWLLWPDSNNSAEGEIDAPEGDLDGVDTIHAYSHDVQGVHSHNAFSSNTGVRYVGSGWHTMDIVWKPSGVTFFLDGRNLGTAPKLGTPVTPMHWILQSETELDRSFALPTTARATIQVDWVAVWKYTPGTPPSAGETPPPPPPSDPLVSTSTLNARVVGVGGQVTTKTTSATSVRMKIGTDVDVTQGVTYTGAVTPNAQGWAKHTATGLTAGTTYYYRVEMTEGTKTPVLDTSTGAGRFKMPPTAATSFSFSFGSCSNVDNPGVMTTIAARNDDLFLHLGDMWYSDGTGVNLSNYRAKMQAKLTASNMQSLVSTTPMAYCASDHDFGMNNNTTGGDSATARDYFNQAYREMVPASPVPATTGTYYTFVWGRVRFINTDLRSFKSSLATAESASNTAMGATQKAWFKNTITAATEKVIFVMSETPWNAPADPAADDWGGYTTERTELANFISASGKRVIFLCGDAHCLGYNPGDANSFGGAPIFQASPFYQTASQKGLGPLMVGNVYPSTGSAVVQQYGRVSVTDAGGAVTVTFKAYSSDNTERKTYTLTVA